MEKTVYERIIDGEIPSSKVYEDADVLAILDITPVNKGHTLVIPKQRFNNIHDLPEELFAKLMVTAKRVATALKKAGLADGINILMNNEAAAGPHITNHAHIHVVPRLVGDGYEVWEGRDLYTPGEMESVAHTLKSTL